jgi:hypothetical protein
LSHSQITKTKHFHKSKHRKFCKNKGKFEQFNFGKLNFNKSFATGNDRKVLQNYVYVDIRAQHSGLSV